MREEKDWNERVAENDIKQDELHKKYNRRLRNGCLGCLFSPFIIVFILVCLFNIEASVRSAFFPLQGLDPGRYISELDSPKGTYTLTLYHSDTLIIVDDYILGVLTDNDTGKTKNIYCNYDDKCNTDDFSWLGDTFVLIDGTILDVRDQIYHNGEIK